MRAGEGASAEGNRPFLDVLDLDTKATRRIWQSAAPFYECPAGTILNEPHTPDGTGSTGGADQHRTVSLDDLQVLFSKETPKDPPQYYIKRFSQVRPAASLCTCFCSLAVACLLRQSAL